MILIFLSAVHLNCQEIRIQMYLPQSFLITSFTFFWFQNTNTKIIYLITNLKTWFEPQVYPGRKTRKFLWKWNMWNHFTTYNFLIKVSLESLLWFQVWILIFFAYTISEYIFIETTSLSLKEIFLGLPKYYIKVRVHLFMLLG